MRKRQMKYVGLAILASVLMVAAANAAPAAPTFGEFIPTSWVTGIENEPLTVPGVELTDTLRGARVLLGSGSIHAMTARLWQPYFSAEWRIGWNGSFPWPGGRTYGSAWADNDSEHWGSHMTITGGAIGCKNFTVTLKDSATGAASEKTYDYMSAKNLRGGYGADGNMTDVDFTHAHQTAASIVLYTRLEAAEVTRWAPPQVIVNGEMVWDKTATYNADPEVGDTPLDDAATAYKAKRGIIDPTLVSTHQLIHAWRMPLGVDVYRKAHMYGNYPDFDYMLLEYMLYNTGNMDRDPDIEHAAALDEFRVAVGFQHYAEHMTRDNIPSNENLDDDRLVYFNPWPSYVDGSSNFRMAAMAFDDDGTEIEGPDYGDAYRKVSETGVLEIGAELYAKAFFGFAYVFAPTEVGGATDDPAQPKAMSYSGENEWRMGRDYCGYDQGLQYQAVWSGKSTTDDTPVRNVPALDPTYQMSDPVVAVDKGQTSYHGLAYTSFPADGALHFVHGVCAGGLDDATSREIAKNVLNRDAAGGAAADRMTMDEINLYLSGEDSLRKNMDRMFWNVNGMDPEAGNVYDVAAKPTAQNQAFNVPDPPRPPEAVWYRNGSAPAGAGVQIHWTQVADETDFDTDVADLAGYRVYRATDTPDSPTRWCMKVRTTGTLTSTPSLARTTTTTWSRTTTAPRTGAAPTWSWRAASSGPGPDGATITASARATRSPPRIRRLSTRPFRPASGWVRTSRTPSTRRRPFPTLCPRPVKPSWLSTTRPARSCAR